MTRKHFLSMAMAAVMLGTSGGYLPAQAEETEDTRPRCGFLTYEIDGDHAVITDCVDEDAVSIIIPPEIEGVPVTVIGKSAFEKSKLLKSISIPDSVTVLEENALKSCPKLTSLYLPDSIQTIGAGALQGCAGLLYLHLPSGLTRIEDNTLRSLDSLPALEIPEGVTYIGERGCAAIMIRDSAENPGCRSTLVVPERVQTVGRGAFEACLHLSSIVFLNPECEIYDDEYTVNNTSIAAMESYYKGTIYGYEGSTAQAYAEKYGYKFGSLGNADEQRVVPGDMNGDGKLAVNDAVLLMRYVSESGFSAEEMPSDIALMLADLETDGYLTVQDVTRLLQKLE